MSNLYSGQWENFFQLCCCYASNATRFFPEVEVAEIKVVNESIISLSSLRSYMFVQTFPDLLQRL